MILKNKKALILSSLLILLPIPVGLLLQKVYPGQMYILVAPDYNSVGLSPTMLYFPSLTLLLGQWIGVYFTAKDPGNKERNRKPLGMVLWIIPILSNLTSGIMYALALGAKFSVSSLMVGAMGLMFAVIGNYMPKMKMNSTMGIKVPWAYSSEENWNATHRFGGKCWVAGGLVMVLAALIPGEFGIVVMLVAIFALSIIPIVYSYRYYRKQQADGKALIPLPKMAKSAWVAIVLLVLFLGVVLFAGDLEYEFGNKYLTVKASFYNDIGIYYADIQSVEYRDGNVPGLRVGGYGSFRLLMGYFQNEEFGTYTRYTYYNPEACIVLSWLGNTVVLSGEDAIETQEIYQELLARTN